MALTLRATKGAKLTNDEADANLTGLASGANMTLPFSVDSGKFAISAGGVLTAGPSSPGVSAYAGAIAHFQKNDSGYIQVSTPNNVFGGVLFGDPESNVIGQVAYSHIDDDLIFVANGAQQLHILGTASASRVITVTGSNGGNPTIDVSAGVLAIGSTSKRIAFPGGAGTLYVGSDGSDNDLQVASNRGIKFQFGGSYTEGARLTEGGYFKASNTATYDGSAGAYHELDSDASGTFSALVKNTHASAPWGLKVGFTASPDDNTNIFLQCADGTTTRLIVYSDGDVQNHDNSYGAISDARLKQDIVDAGSQWQDIKNLRVRKYRFKSDVAAGKDHQQIGLIAQEVLQVSPGLVQKNINGFAEQYGLEYSVLHLKALKALQEAMARIERLEALALAA